METLVVNLYGGPGSGKSTMSARLFSELKELGINAELVTEYAKDLVWQESTHVLDNQLYIFAKQYHRLWRVMNKVDVIITDSPLLLSTIYGETSSTFKKLVLEEINKMNTLNIFLERVKPYNPAGRLQSEFDAKMIDDLIRLELEEKCIPYTSFKGEYSSTSTIVQLITLNYKI